MLHRVKRLNLEAPAAYAAPQEEAVINLNDVQSAVLSEQRGSGPFTLVTFCDGRTMVIVGTPADLALAWEEADRA